MILTTGEFFDRCIVQNFFCSTRHGLSMLFCARQFFEILSEELGWKYFFGEYNKKSGKWKTEMTQKERNWRFLIDCHWMKDTKSCFLLTTRSVLRFHLEKKKDQRRHPLGHLDNLCLIMLLAKVLGIAPKIQHCIVDIQKNILIIISWVLSNFGFRTTFSTQKNRKA